MTTANVTETPRLQIPPSEAAVPAARRLVLRNFSMLIALVLIWVFFSLAVRQPRFVFVSPGNLSNLTVEFAMTAVLALGMLLVIVCGHIDLSVGSGAGLFGGVAAVLIFHYRWPAPPALLAALVGAVLLWALMGALVVREKIPAFIITLAGLLIFRGLHWLVIGNVTVPVTTGRANLYSMLTTYALTPGAGYALAAAVIGAMTWSAVAARRRRVAFGLSADPPDLLFARLFIAGQLVLLFTLVCNQHRGIPLTALILGAAAFITWVLTQHTRFGRYLYAVGGNEEAAVISGIPVDRVVIGAYAIMGLLVALTGFMQTAYSGASTTTVGSLLELDAIAACVIGGTSLRGGRGTVPGVLFGALIMASLMNGMTLWAVAPESKLIARGLVLALAVWMDVRLSRG